MKTFILIFMMFLPNGEYREVQKEVQFQDGFWNRDPLTECRWLAKQLTAEANKRGTQDGSRLVVLCNGSKEKMP